MKSSAKIKIEVENGNATVEIAGKGKDVVTELTYLVVKNKMFRDLLRESLELAETFFAHNENK